MSVCGIICNQECGKPGKTSSRFLTRNGLGGKPSYVMSGDSEIRLETGFQYFMTGHHSYMVVMGCFFPFCLLFYLEALFSCGVWTVLRLEIPLPQPAEC